jgi:hypothetical protein
MMLRKLSRFASVLLVRRADTSRFSVASDVYAGDISADAFHGAPGFYGRSDREQQGVIHAQKRLDDIKGRSRAIPRPRHFLTVV